MRKTVERMLSRHHRVLCQVILTEEVQGEHPEETQAEIFYHQETGRRQGELFELISAV